MEQNILVSVVCNTYNHKDYIEQALMSIVSQQTNFLYEILVHDDCSTDGTKEIIEELAIKFPDKIKPIFEETNQHCKGISFLNKINEKAKGKYIAICEGDDYWCDTKNYKHKQIF